LQLSGVTDNLKDADILNITALTCLQILTISQSSNLTSATCIRLMTSLTSLVELNLSLSSKLTKPSLSYVTGLTNLTTLDISETDFPVDSFTSLTFLKNLTMRNCKHVNPGDLVVLKKLPFLDFLVISDYPFKRVEMLSYPTNLTHLDMANYTNIEDIGPIFSLTKLKSLTLDSAFWSTFEFAERKAVDSERELEKLTHHLTNLEQLSINKWYISDPGLEHLARLPNLVMLSVMNCDQLTKAAIKAFCVQHPNIVVKSKYN